MFKKLTIILTALLFLVSPARALAIDGFVKVTSPSGGETFTEGQTINITWDSSSNIDQVSIMYKSDAHHGNWVAFSTTNTHSYSWNVDVGNTTNTQFYIEITGYETGKGSTTAFGGYFTVNQKPDAPTPQPTSTSTPSPTQNNNSNYVPYRTPSSTLTPFSSPKPSAQAATPTPRPITPRLSVTTLVLYQEFYFEGSTTTNLKDIKDPSHVENFTLDTQEGYTFVFADTLNLTEGKTLQALANTKDYWVYEEWFVWIKTEWWVKYDIQETVDVTYKNDALTGFAPSVVAETKSSPAPTSTPTPTVLGAKAGQVKLAIKDGTPLRVTPHVELDSPASPITTASITLTGKTSHTNLTWTLNHNGNKTEVSPTINADDGTFTIPVSGLVEGANTFTLSYQEDGKDPVNLESVTVISHPSFWSRYGHQITVYGVALAAALSLFFSASPKAQKQENPTKNPKKN